MSVRVNKTAFDRLMACLLALECIVAAGAEPQPTKVAIAVTATKARPQSIAPNPLIATVLGKEIRSNDLDFSPEESVREWTALYQSIGETMAAEELARFRQAVTAQWEQMGPGDKRACRINALKTQIWKILVDQYRIEHKLEATESEIAEVLDSPLMKLRQKELENVPPEVPIDPTMLESLPTRERDRLKRINQKLMAKLSAGNPRSEAIAAVEDWKFDKALYDQYGGAVIATTHAPIEAHRRWLEEHEKNGRLKIHDAEMKRIFWNDYKCIRTSYPIDDRANPMEKPWWLEPIDGSGAQE